MAAQPMTTPADLPPDSETPPAPQPGHPDWRPPRGRDGQFGSIVVGLFFLFVGIWFFLDRTLGIEMPDVNWNAVWPVVLVLLGAVILVRSVANRN
jgi:uncharacterized integral membrane protein